MATFEKLREEHATLFTETQAVFDKAEGENRPLTDEEKQANEGRFTRMAAIKQTLDDHTKFAAFAIASGKATAAAEPPGKEQLEATDAANEFAALPSANGSHADQRDAQFQRHVAAVNHWLRTGETRHGQFALTTSSGGGVLLPTRVAEPLVVKRMLNPIRAALAARGRPVMQTPGFMGNVSLPTFDDVANTADVITQDATGDNPKDPAVSGMTLGAIQYDSGTIWASRALLSSVGYDLLAYLRPQLTERIDQKQSAAWMTSLKAAAIGVTTATATGVTYANLLRAQHSIPYARRRNGVWFLSDGFFELLRGMLDANNRPIYQESLRDEEPNRLLGWPVFISEELDPVGANATTGIVASTDHLFVRDVSPNAIENYPMDPQHPGQFGTREIGYGDFAFIAAGVRRIRMGAA